MVVSFAIVLPLKSAIVDWEYVPSGSMEPSIIPLELLTVNKLAYDLKIPFTTIHLAQWGDPRRGDVVVFFSPKDELRLIKRVIGLPGDTIEMRDDHLWINGVPLDYTSLPDQTADVPEAHGHETLRFATEKLRGRPHPVMILPQRLAVRTFEPRVVPAGCYFVMGDNRDDSNDSRFIGVITRDRIVGRAGTIIASVDLGQYGRPRFDRFFSVVP